MSTDTTITTGSTGTGAGSAELLAAGAVLPADATGAGPSAVPLTARTYRHPALGDERVVVRLAAAELGPAEDLASGFLGLVLDGEPPVVGLGRRAALGFPEWVLVHHPDDGHHALAVVPELDRIARQAKTKPKAALDACHELAERLAAAVPHFLPVFYEQTARIFLGIENTTYAAQLFGKARASEAGFGLDVDEDRLDAVFLEFALAGALPVKVLTGYGKELALRVSPAEAFERFRRLCVRRTAGGLAPSAQATVELRRLARAAGLTGGVPEQEYLAELLPLPATQRAAAGWWKSHRATLVALARRVPAVRGTLLGTNPSGAGGEAGDMAVLWLRILEESGATAGLADGSLPAEERPADGTAGWLERFHTSRFSGWGTPPALPELLPLVTRCAERLRTELALPERAEGLRLDLQDVDLLDLVLSLGLPLADPDPDATGKLGLRQWALTPGRRDLRALCADARLRPAVLRTLRGFDGHMQGGRSTVQLLATTPGSSPLIAEWVREVAAVSTAAGLPDLPEAVRRLTWMPPEALALAPEEVARAAAADLSGILARTLRGGIFEELVWPAWEQTVREMSPRRSGHRLTVMDAWPYVIVANSAQVRVVGPDSVVLTHDLRIPSGNNRQPGFHHVDGDLLVFWAGYDGPVQGYWLSAPDDLLTLDSSATYWSVRSEAVTLPLPAGGRTTGGGGPLHPGDSKLPAERAVISDGTSYWVWEPAAPGDRHDAAGWAEYDPATGTRGRRSLPGFLADALRGHPRGAALPDSPGQNWLRPAPAVEDSVLGAPVDGLLGWRTVRLPGQGWHGSDTAGRSVTLPEGTRVPRHALALPGDDRLRAVSSEWRTLTLTDPDGVPTARVSGDHHSEVYSAEGAELPPLPYWYCLRPRDPRGSAVLRAMDTAGAEALLKLATEAEKTEQLPALVAAALPGITEGALVRGVVDRIRTTLTQRKALAGLAAALKPKPAADRAPKTVKGPADQLLGAALIGLVGTGHHRYGGPEATVFHHLHALAGTVADTGAEAVPGRLHVDLPRLPYASFPWTALFLDEPAAVAYRAVVTGTTEEQRTALCRVLSEVDALGLGSAQASAASWRQVRGRIEESHLRGADGRERGHGGRHHTVLPLGGGAALGISGFVEGEPGGRDFRGLLHDPDGRFELPAPYTGLGTPTVPGDPERAAGWLAAFLRETAARGPAPWFPEAAEEFSRLTGVSGTVARLVLAGLPHMDTWERGFLPAELRTTLKVTATAAANARDELKELKLEVRRALVGALLPADPALLWTDGPDAAAAALVWNRRVGRRTPVPDWLLAEATKEVRGGWAPHRALPALLDPSAAPALSADVAWRIEGDHAEPSTPVSPASPCSALFDTQVLTGSVALTAWMAHRLPAGHPVRACLPPALTAVRQRLASPELLLSVGHYIDAARFREAAGTATETGEGYERYGAVVLALHDGRPRPALRPALLDSTGSDPYLPLLRGPEQRSTPAETALRLAHDPGFAALLADPGAPVAGAVDKEGTWWPQDPSRSVPELVAEASAAYGLGADAAALYLTLLAMPDPTDRNTARWTGWKPARLRAARAELAATDLVVTAARPRAGRSLFLPGGWAAQDSPVLPVELWKLPMYALAPGGGGPVLGVLVPAEPAADLYRRAWGRVREGDAPRFEELKVKRAPARRRR
ncbi:DNA-binding protein [Streptomyces sp. NBC_00249]|uniref:DNA-binding protein n=1 Tax=Streptomyces sp. NBC_00249 TaxID=2975690 RepID=UPI002254C8F7|nr:DNA-binding protein [Streptomyces sp. NBC_00249]MCX5195222.1 DNA-binding protein [Streptomyces sp. NBC_00249]